MTQLSWRQKAGCFFGALKPGDERPELFARSWLGLWAVYWRVPIFLWSLITIIWSTAAFWGSVDKYMLYMTHWGLLLILVESFFGVIVALKEDRYLPGLPEPIHTDATTPDYGSFVGSLKNENTKGAFPWYVKVYWVLYNITIPVAFLITVFYWSILNTAIKKVNYAPNPTLDVMLHGVNSLVMLAELFLSAHPSRLLHVMQPLYFGVVYLIFTIVYYDAGGLDPWGHVFIYPVIDWSKPEQTLVVASLTGLFLVLMHVLTVGVATSRDIIARRCRSTPNGLYNDGFEA
ncbi:PREDICTED: protein rolling stone-like isoform X2 [Papilio xuthus]|uniref:Protein rolling stone-like isoform X2 n=1 Tax=Papilio xuthus TaxID=66420 RepID=A0AAJ6ZQ87_PAPXU|nr:PREDICTED: protein rolling stone-like isoform X2 [Papilio xuthus]